MTTHHKKVREYLKANYPEVYKDNFRKLEICDNGDVHIGVFTIIITGIRI